MSLLSYDKAAGYDFTGTSGQDVLFQDRAGTTPIVDRLGRAKPIGNNQTLPDLVANSDTDRMGFDSAEGFLDGSIAGGGAIGDLADGAIEVEVYVVIRFMSVSTANVHLLDTRSPTDNRRIWAFGTGGNSFKVYGVEDNTPYTPLGTWNTLEMAVLQDGSLVHAFNGEAWITDGSWGFNAVNRFSLSHELDPITAEPTATGKHWDGKIARMWVQELTADPTESNRIEARAWVESTGPVGPTTNEELFNASYADASAADPKVTALIRPADVQRSIDTDVSNLKDGPNLYTVEAIFDIGELENLNPYNSTTEKPRVFFVKDDQPGLREGKNLLLKSYTIRDADPAVPVTCTFWG